MTLRAELAEVRRLLERLVALLEKLEADRARTVAQWAADQSPGAVRRSKAASGPAQPKPRDAHGAVARKLKRLGYPRQR